MIEVGDKLPDAVLLQKGADGIVKVPLADRLAGRRVVIVAVPGAFTPTCDAMHLPSFIRTKADFDAKGIDEIICVSVNDAHVMAAWGESTGASAAGISMLADGDSSFTKALGLAFTAEAAGMIDRSKRYAMLVEDGVLKVFQLEKPGECAISTGEAMLEEV